MILRTLITDFSHVYTDMGFIDELKNEGYPTEVVDLSSIEGTNCYCAPDAEDDILRSVAPFSDFPIRWIDSGDYHYMTKILSAGIQEPFDLLLLDHHPDDQEPEFDGVLSCGSWVNEIKRENPFLKDVITIGPDSRQTLSDRSFGNLYISLDKDIMSREWARTDWSQGEFTLDEILSMIGAAIDRSDHIIAIDICGEISILHGATPEDMRINLETNLRIQHYISEKLTNEQQYEIEKPR